MYLKQHLLFRSGLGSHLFTCKLLHVRLIQFKVHQYISLCMRLYIKTLAFERHFCLALIWRFGALYRHLTNGYYKWFLKKFSSAAIFLMTCYYDSFFFKTDGKYETLCCQFFWQLVTSEKRLHFSGLNHTMTDQMIKSHNHNSRYY